MIYVAVAIGAAAFMAAIRLLGIVPITARVIATTRGAARMLRDPGLSEAAREGEARRASLILLRACGELVARTVTAAGLAFVSLFALQASGLADLAAVGALLASWEGMALTAVAMTATFCVRLRP